MEEQDNEIVKFLTKKIEWDAITFFSFFLIIIALGLITYFIGINKIGKCTSQPFEFGIQQLKQNTDAEMITGSITLIKKGTSKTVFFGDEIPFDYNSTNFTIEK